MIEQVEAGQAVPPNKGEAKGLFSLAQELRALAPPVALPAETEHRIFAKMQALAPDLHLEDAYSLDEELAAVAQGLKSLATASLTQESEDRIFARVQQKMPELASSQQRVGLSWGRRIAAFMPGGPIQRKADALARMIDRAAAGETGLFIGAGGRMGRLLHAAMSLGPLPAVEPSPSFVDWLEVRLASSSNALQPARRNRAAALLGSINLGLHDTRFQGALAGAAAILVAIGAFSLNGATDRSGPESPVAISVPKADVSNGPNVPNGDGGSPAPTLEDKGQPLANNVPGGSAAPIDPKPGSTNNPTPDPTTSTQPPPPPPDGAASVAVNAGRDETDRLFETLTQIGGPR